ncbi:phosphoglycerate kinase [Natronobacterium gregoryi]|uniref:Phosphoglycerate kinase n=2 Tax=Natronobacterium gregoryi TaxID=44930 RepID=L0AGB4_NATGS|nr:phosphoglycerate kinase [Natronobacterium gregoryi]AFZ72861.1 3-phosphoglycerate kinase [Natronobacterium gregoryi SP2]ELY69649.1 phosphoglycerate kinase [Natronobacterium gregoryi SP2]PLK21910.1 phosphoglycerate kinase [Natronobacterium gregoryi SP2]SFI65931.1 phosphoglycerate kinase [Natronobacterium gregoryi]
MSTTTSTFQTIDDLESGQQLLVRIDINAPVEDGVVQDNRRFARHAETIAELLADDHAVALLAHQGRPGRDTFISLEGHADILADHLGQEVAFVDDTVGEDALEAIGGLEAGDVLLLENARMCEEELPEEAPDEKADTEFVQTLAPEFDAYVNDAYSAAHRSHASLVGFPRVLDAYAGRVMESEYTANSAIQQREFDGLVTMVLGGTKAEDLIPVIEEVDDTVDRFCLGGIVGELFLRADGHDVGYDVEGTEFFDHQWEDHADTIEGVREEYGDRLHLASDLASETDDGERVERAVAEIEKETSYLDVGSDTADEYADLVAESEAVFVKGALGVFEDERFADGTVAVLSAIAEADCFSVVGGGDTSRAIPMYDLEEEDFSHVSVAGGAYVRALTGEGLVGVEVLEAVAESE